jgi:hypothetical protein
MLERGATLRVDPMNYGRRTVDAGEQGLSTFKIK